MSVTYLSIAVIGCEVTDKIETTRDVRSCSHANGRWLFCPQCGKPKWETQAVDLNEEWDKRLSRVGLSLVTTSSYHGDARVFVGLAAESSPGGAFGVDMRAPDVSAQVRAALETVGLWDPATFRLWAVGYCS